jgi:hypothetical protein
MELTAPHREPSGTSTQSTSTGPGLAPLTLPVRTIKPWFGISFHSTQISTVLGVLLYPNLGGVARHAWLGSRAVSREPLGLGPRPEQNHPIPTELRKHYVQNVGGCSIVRGPWL